MQHAYSEQHEINGFSGVLFREFRHHEINGKQLLNSQKWLCDPVPAPQFTPDAEVLLSFHFDDLHGIGAHLFRVHALVHHDFDEDDGSHSIIEINPKDVESLYLGLSPLFRWQCMTPDGAPPEFLEWRDVIYFDGSIVPHKIEPKFANFLRSHVIQAENGSYRIDDSKGPLELKHMPVREPALAEAWLEGLRTSSFRIAHVPVEPHRERKASLERLYEWSMWPTLTDEQWQQKGPQLLEAFRNDVEGIGFWWDVEQMKSDPQAPWNSGTKSPSM